MAFLQAAATSLAAERHVLETGASLVNQLQAREANGMPGQLWLTSIVPLRTPDGAVVGLVGSSREITERLQAEASFKESEERLRLALEAADMASWDWNAATGTAVRTAGMPALFGLPPEAANAPRAAYRERVHPDDRGALVQADRRLAGEQGTYEVEYRVVHPNGHVRWLRDRGVAIPQPEGALGRVLGITQDVTDRKRHEDELRATLEAAEEASHLKSAFLSTMSHELRTPMNAIIGYAHLLLDGFGGPLSPSQVSDVEHIAEGADRLLGSINDVLDLSRIEADRLELVKEPLDFAPLLAEVVAQIAPLAAQRGLAVTVKSAPNVPLIPADPQRIRQVLLNLIGNAIKFTP